MPLSWTPITIYKRFGQVLIAEKEAAQYYWVGTDVFDFRAERHAKFALLSVTYFLTEPSYVNMQILDDAGKVLATPLDKAFRQSGLQREILNGRWGSVTPFIDGQALEVSNAALAHAPPVPSGRYFVRLTISATYSSYKYFEKAVESEVDF